MIQKLTSRVVLAAALFTSFFGAASAQAGSVSCNVIEVAFAGNNRVHVRCSNAALDTVTGAQIFFYSVAIDDSRATVLVDLANAATSQNRQLDIFFNDGDTSGSSFGCLAGDCRVPTNLYLN